MAILSLDYTIQGQSPLLVNNPQCADPLNKYSKLKKPLTSKRQKTDQDHADIHDLDIRSKIYWDDELKIYIPTSWVLASICKWSHSVCKVAKAKVRAGVFPTESKAKLTYDKQNLVKEPSDVVKNEYFRFKMILPQGQVRIAKSFPIFHNWSFSGSLDFDDSVISKRDLIAVLTKSCKYGGFGDFRPTFGKGEFNEN